MSTFPGRLSNKLKLLSTMIVTVQYRGQLSFAMGLDFEEVHLREGTSIEMLLKELAERGGEKFGEIALDGEGVPLRTLLVAVDGIQVTDFRVPIDDQVKEITLIPPIAGG